MTLLNYIVWDPNPIFIDFGILRVAYYGILFATGFLISQQILFYIFRKEGRPEKDVEILTIYMVIATILGARLGHVLFYEPDIYLSDPIKILRIWEGGLASHGATIGILIALYLYSKKKADQSYLWVLDRLVIVIALTGCLIRLGNFINSEIIGLPTESESGVVFARNAEEALEYNIPQIEEVDATRGADDPVNSKDNYVQVTLAIEFKPGNFEENALRSLLDNNIKNVMVNYSNSEEPHIYEPPGEPLQYTLSLEEGHYIAQVQTFGIPRHPAQLYESLSCLLLFFLLFYIWTREKQDTPEGLFFGIFLIVVFGLRFVYEFLKEDQVDFEAQIPLNMGQWLSIPLVIAGIIITYKVLTKNKKKITGQGTGS